MATYVNNLRLTELATGEGSGTWGTTTNTSLELIGEALGYNTQNCFSSDADATTTVADGASDPARSFYFKVTSSATLSATRTLTIAPNTLSRVMFIENATTGSQSIAISQGSGANVTIATGKTAVVYLDGAGSTAAVVDAMAGVDPGITDTLAEVLVAGNTSGGTNIELTTTDKVQFRDSAIYLNSSADGQLDIVADTEVQIAATTIDINGNVDISGTAGIGGVLTANAGVVVDTITIDGSEIDASSSLSLDIGGNLTIDVDGSTVTLADGGVNFGQFYQNASGQFNINAPTQDKDIVFLGNDGGSSITALTLDMSSAGAATFNSTIDSGNITSSGTINMNTDSAALFLGADIDMRLTHDGSNGTLRNDTGDLTLDVAGDIILDAAGDDITFKTGGVEFGSIAYSNSNLLLTSAVSNGDMVFRGNDGGSTINALVLDMSDGGAAVFNSTVTSTGLTVNASGGRQNINTGHLRLSNDYNLEWGGGTNFIRGNNSTGAMSLTATGDLTLDVAGDIILDADGADVIFKDGGTTFLEIDKDGNNARIKNPISDGDVLIQGSDAGSIITALSFDMSAAGAATFNDDINLSDGKRLRMGTGGDFEIFHDGSNNIFKGATSDQDMKFNGVDSGSEITALTLDMSAAGIATFNSGINIGNRGSASDPTLQSSIDPDTGVFWGGGDILGFSTGGSEAMRIDSSGNLLVNGTNATAKLVVDGAANSYATRFNSSTTTGQAFGARIRAGTNSSDYALLVENTSASSMLTVRGDGNVGIAESDPQGLLHVDGFDYSYFSSNVGSATLDNQQGLAIGWNKSAGAGETVLIANQGAGSAGGMAFATNTSAGSYNERMRIDASGNVGLNTSSPSTYDSRANNLVVGDSGDAGVTIFSGSTSNARLQFAPSGATGLDNGLIDYDNNNDSMSFATGGSERMRLDASGNLLVGRTSVGTTGTGHSIRGGDSAIFARAGGEVAIFSRSDSDGEILRFDGNGSAGVGSIGAFSSRMYIGTGDTGLQFLSSADNIIPIDPSGPSNRDAAIDLGASGVRFKDLYLSGAVNLGGDVLPTTDAGFTGHSDLGSPSKRFEDAYVRDGVTTGSDGRDKQDIEELSDAEQRVAVACKGLLRKWRWIDAVEAKGDDARIHFGIIAQDLQDAFTAEGLDAGRYAMFISTTWTDEETGEERTRLGVRYSELLAFIIAAI